MSLTFYDASIPTYLRLMRNLSAMLDKAEAWSKENSVELSTLAEAKLAPDMFALVRQIQAVSDGAKGGVARLAGVEVPSYPDDETTFADMKARLAKTIAFIETITPEQVNGDPERIIELKLPSRTMTFTAKDFLFQFSLPNAYFHVVAAYAILRNQGVPVGKMDYLAGPAFAG